LLQPGRREAFEKQTEKNRDVFPFPKSWVDLPALHPEGLKFAVMYSGFATPNVLYKSFYQPKINCETLHFIGSLDSVVEENRSLALANGCEDGKVIHHPGGHFVPVGKEMGGVLVGFLRDCLAEKKEEEESVEDMDVPF
jgi:hypothetical protein